MLLSCLDRKVTLIASFYTFFVNKKKKNVGKNKIIFVENFLKGRVI